MWLHCWRGSRDAGRLINGMREPWLVERQPCYVARHPQQKAAIGRRATCEQQLQHQAGERCDHARSDY